MRPLTFFEKLPALEKERQLERECFDAIADIVVDGGDPRRFEIRLNQLLQPEDSDDLDIRLYWNDQYMILYGQDRNTQMIHFAYGPDGRHPATLFSYDKASKRSNHQLWHFWTDSIWSSVLGCKVENPVANKLNFDCMSLIFRYLGSRDIMRCRALSRHWRAGASRNQLWLPRLPPHARYMFPEQLNDDGSNFRRFIAGNLYTPNHYDGDPERPYIIAPETLLYMGRAWLWAHQNIVATWNRFRAPVLDIVTDGNDYNRPRKKRLPTIKVFPIQSLRVPRDNRADELRVIMAVCYHVETNADGEKTGHGALLWIMRSGELRIASTNNTKRGYISDPDRWLRRNMFDYSDQRRWL